MKTNKKTLGELAKKIDAELKGDADCVITGIAALQSAQSGHLSFLNNTKYRHYLSNTQASAVILTEADFSLCSTNALVVEDPYYAYAQLAKEFSEEVNMPSGIHASAVVGKGCQIDSTVSIGANVVIGDRVRIGANTQISSGCVIGDDCSIDQDSFLWANVTLYYAVRLGARALIHSGAIIGSDGFGFANHKGVWHKVPQLGTVIVEDDVEIGANTTIDRGAIDNTIIEKGVKLDNQIQVAHNVQIGAHTAIAGCVAIAGSTKIGKYCMIGGGSCINGHIEIADGVMLTGMSMITHSIKERGVYSSGTGFMENRKWHKNVIRFRHLDELARRVQDIIKER